MTNINKIEDKLNNLSTNYIYNEAVTSLLLLLLSRAENIEKEFDFIPYEIHNDIIEIQNLVNNYVLELKSILNGSSELRASALDDCIALKQELISIYSPIFSYYTIYNIYSSPIYLEMAIRQYKKDAVSIKDTELNMIYMDCSEFLNSAKDENQQTQFKQKLMGCLPIKLTKEKYYDFIKTSLNSEFVDVNEDVINSSLETLKRGLSPESDDNYGKYFPDIVEFFTSTKDLKPSTLSDDELDNLHSDFSSVIDSLINIEDYFGTLFNDVNSLIVLFYLDYSLEDLTEENFAYSDLYHIVCQVIKNKNDTIENSLVLEPTLKLLNDYIDKLIDKTTEINEKEVRYLEKIKDFNTLSDNTKKTLMSETFVRECYFENLEDALYNFNVNYDLPTLSENHKEQKIDEFIESLKSHFSNLPMLQRKTEMMLLFTALSSSLSCEYILNYIKLCIETAPSVEHANYIINRICSVFLDFGFKDTDNEDEYDDYDDPCDCGHDHHHHDCDCGCDHDH